MPLETVRVTAVLPIAADRVYAAWIDSEGHSAMTGAGAVVDPRVGGSHSAWDGYITGTIVELRPGRRIVQTWRSSEFPSDHADSRLEILLREVAAGCEITVVHSDIPEGQGAQYESGWNDHYFTPMRKHFAKRAEAAAAPTKAAAASRLARAAKAPKKTKAAKAPKKTKAAKAPEETRAAKASRKTKAPRKTKASKAAAKTKTAKKTGTARKTKKARTSRAGSPRRATRRR